MQKQNGNRSVSEDIASQTETKLSVSYAASEDVKKLSREISGEAVRLRRQLHKTAELSFCEYKTSAFINEYLKRLGLLVKTGLAGTGVIGFLDAGKPNTLLIRADMDALPIDEAHEFDYKSQTKGVMHACGHDAHMAVALCTAKILTRLKQRLSSNVLFVFQPGEETTGGAELMIKSGILKEFDVTEAVGLHVMNDVEAGRILLKKGPLMASPDDFDLYIHGRGGHGAYPHECVDPIALSARIIADFDMIGSRFVSPFEQKVISVCSVNGGSFYNIIPDTVHMRGTVRSYDENTRRLLPKMMKKAVEGICGIAGARFEFQYNFRYPPLINDDKAVERMEKAVAEALGRDTVVFGRNPSMAGDDFSYFAKAVPSVYFYLGSGNKKKGITMPLHSSSFDIDEDCLKTGISAMALYAVSEH